MDHVIITHSYLRLTLQLIAIQTLKPGTCSINHAGWERIHFSLAPAKRMTSISPSLSVSLPREKVTGLCAWKSDFPEPRGDLTAFLCVFCGKREAAWWGGLPLCFLRSRPQVKTGGPGNPLFGLEAFDMNFKYSLQRSKSGRFPMKI